MRRVQRKLVEGWGLGIEEQPFDSRLRRQFADQGQVVLDRPMDQLTDDFFAVRGVREDLDHLPDVLIGVRRTATNFTAIVAADQTAGLPPSVLVEAADVDDVAKALAVPVEGIDL